MSQTTLRIPCLPCGVDCLWPPSPLNGVLATFTGFSNAFLCPTCGFFNDTFFLPFLSITPGPFVVCTYRFDFPLQCGVDHIILGVAPNPPPAEVFLSLGILGPLSSTLARYQTAITTLQASGNGPFVLTQTGGDILRCNFGTLSCAVQGVP